MSWKHKPPTTDDNVRIAASQKTTRVSRLSNRMLRPQEHSLYSQRREGYPGGATHNRPNPDNNRAKYIPTLDHRQQISGITMRMHPCLQLSELIATYPAAGCYHKNLAMTLGTVQRKMPKTTMSLQARI
jgi:hypothetical protein